MIFKLTRTVWTKAVLFGLLMICPAVCVAQSPETEAVKIPIENYFKAQATGDAEYIKKAFHPEAKLFFVREGKFSQFTLVEFAGRFTGKPAPDEAQRKRRIDSIDITGNVAVVKVVLEYPTVTFTRKNARKPRPQPRSGRAGMNRSRKKSCPTEVASL